MDEEGPLGSLRHEFVMMDISWHYKQGKSEAKRLIRMSYRDQYLLGTGPNSREIRKMLGYVQDPTSHIDLSLNESVEEEENDNDNEEEEQELLKYLELLTDL